MTEKRFMFHHLQRVHAGKYSGFSNGQYIEVQRKQGEWRLYQFDRFGQLYMTDKPRWKTLEEARLAIEAAAKELSDQIPF
jgi:hypothetical protein